MTKRTLPSAPQLRADSSVKFDLAPRAFDRWNPGVRAAAEDDDDIGIFDVIGEDFWGEGVTAKRISGALRRIGADNPVVVNINSPGGDLFEGLAIYNLLREHKGEVTVNVLGMAASAASVIAMAGDVVQIARAGFFMIHDTWTLAVGNRHDMQAVAEFLEPLDRAMADVYSVRTGESQDDIMALMDAETWIAGSDAVAQGFADALLPSDQVREESAAANHRLAARKMDVALAKAGLARSERRRLISDFKSSTHDAAGSGKPGAADHDTPCAVAKGEVTQLSAQLKKVLS